MLLNLSETEDAGQLQIVATGGEVHRESSQGDIRLGDIRESK